MYEVPELVAVFPGRVVTTTVVEIVGVPGVVEAIEVPDDMGNTSMDSCMGIPTVPVTEGMRARSSSRRMYVVVKVSPVPVRTPVHKAFPEVETPLIEPVKEVPPIALAVLSDISNKACASATGAKKKSNSVQTLRRFEKRRQSKKNKRCIFEER